MKCKTQVICYHQRKCLSSGIPTAYFKHIQKRNFRADFAFKSYTICTFGALEIELPLTCGRKFLMEITRQLAEKSEDLIYLTIFKRKSLKVKLCKLYDKKIYDRFNTNNTEIFAFIIAVIVFTFLSRKVFFIHRKDNRNLKSILLLRQ